ncbi:MAG: hypothetical protein J6A30_02270 [Ruminococcus sp.]|nr:hypothetical protein [Ruminococcus sp.]
MSLVDLTALQHGYLTKKWADCRAQSFLELIVQGNSVQIQPFPSPLWADKRHTSSGNGDY